MNIFKLFSFFTLTYCLVACSATPEGKFKKIFKYNQPGGVRSLDPAQANNQAKVRATTLLYNGLFEYDENQEIVNTLADSCVISNDGKTYTITIKKGVYFHDHKCFEGGKGREVKAADFVYSFFRVLEPSSRGSWIFADKVLLNSKGEASDTCFQTIDDYTFKIHLQRPFGPFKDILTMPYTYVVPEEAVKMYDDQFGLNPVGTGPFKVSYWEKGKQLVVLKNENYWRKDKDGNALPYIDGVQVMFLGEKSTEFIEFTQGKFHFISGLDDNSRAQVLNGDGSIKPEIEAKFQVQRSPYLNTEYIGFLLDKKYYEDRNHPLLNKKVRQALNYAIDRDKIVNYIRSNQGHAAKQGFIPHALKSFDENVKGYNYDPKKAVELLIEAGYGGSGGIKMPTLKLYTNPEEYRQVAEFLRKQWLEIGIEVNIEVNQFPTHKKMVRNGTIKMFRGGWLGDYPQAENFLSLYYSKNAVPVGPNDTRFSNPEYDKYFEMARAETNDSLRTVYYREMDKILIDEAPFIALYYDEALRLMSKKVSGIWEDPMNSLKLDWVKIAD